MCVGKNYLEHVGEVDSTMPGISKAKVPEWPIIFLKSFIGCTKPSATMLAVNSLAKQTDTYSQHPATYRTSLMIVDRIAHRSTSWVLSS